MLSASDKICDMAAKELTKVNSSYAISYLNPELYRVNEMSAKFEKAVKKLQQKRKGKLIEQRSICKM